MKKNVLLLGGGGFIGSHLAMRLLEEENYNPIIFDIDTRKPSVLGFPDFNVICGDVDDDVELGNAVSQCDIVVDLVAYANPSLYIKKPLDVVGLNFHKNLEIVNWAKRLRKRLFVFSTSEVYGMTTSMAYLGKSEREIFHEDSQPMIYGPTHEVRWIYACAKQLLERVIHSSVDLDWTIIRPFNFIGPEIDYLPSESQDGGIPRVFSCFYDALKTNTPLQLVDGGTQKRSYTYIDDACDAIVGLMKTDASNKEIFNIGNPKNETTIRNLGVMMYEIYHNIVEPYSPFGPTCNFNILRGEDFYGKGYADCDRRIPDISKLESTIGWEPRYDLYSTVKKTMEYFSRK